jgi:hypothetical protein
MSVTLIRPCVILILITVTLTLTLILLHMTISDLMLVTLCCAAPALGGLHTTGLCKLCAM